MKLKHQMIFVMFFAVMFFLAISSCERVNAAALSISVSNSNPNVGESVKVNITSEYTGRVNLSTSGGNLSDSKVWVEKNTQSVTLTSNSAGKVTITATAEGGKLSTSAGDEPDVPAQSATVTFVEKSSSNENNNNNNNNGGENKPTETAKSKNANLKNLGIRPNDFKGFKSGTTSYNATVPNNVEQVEVYATASDSKANVTGTGKKKLNVGSNKLDVVVTAEDGTKKTYTINVTRQEETQEQENNTTPEETNTVQEQQEENNESSQENNANNSPSDLIKLEVSGFSLTPAFSPDVYSYTLNMNTDLTSLDVVAEGANHGVNVDIVGNTDLKDGENIITVLVYNEETKANSTYQIIVNKTSVDLDALNTTINDAVNKANRIRIILLGVLIFIVVCIIIFAIVKFKYKTNNTEYDLYEYDEDDIDKFDNQDGEQDESNRNIFEEDKNEEEKIEKNSDGEKSKITQIADSIFEDDINEIPRSLQKQEEYEEENFRKNKKKGKHF